MADNVIQVNTKSVNGLISQIRALGDDGTADRLQAAVSTTASPADLGRVYAEASAVIRRHFSGRPGINLPAGLGSSPLYDREGMALVREIAPASVSLDGRERGPDFSRIGALMVG